MAPTMRHGRPDQDGHSEVVAVELRHARGPPRAPRWGCGRSLCTAAAAPTNRPDGSNAPVAWSEHVAVAVAPVRDHG